jgi:glycosyltransferase involved in cell wall biosynthesis
MPVLHLITGLHLGGAETALYRYLKMQLPSEDKVVSLTDFGYYGEKLTLDGVDVSNVGMDKKDLFGTVLALVRLIVYMRRERPVSIVCWMYHPMLLSFFIKLVLPKSRIVWMVRHSLDGLHENSGLTNFIIKVCAAFSRFVPNAIVFNSLRSKQQHIMIGYRKHSSLWVPNGVDLRHFCPDVLERNNVRAEMGVRDSQFVVVFVGRLEAIKGPEIFLQALCFLEELDFFAVVVGREGKYRKSDLLQFLPDRLRERFKYIGETADVVRYLRAADLFVNSSHSEGFPNSLIEAMAVGLPCVATDVGDSATIVEGCGIVVPPNDPAKMASAIRTIANDKAYLVPFAPSINVVSSRFNSTIVFSSLTQVILGED